MYLATGRPLLAAPPDPLTVVSAAPAPTPVPSYMDLVRNFDYNSKAPLDTQEKLIAEVDSLKYIEISYDNPRRWRVMAEIIEPSGPGPYPGIIYLCSNQSDLNAFFDEARSLAQTGAVVMLIDTSARQPELNLFHQSINSLTIQSIIDVRRAVDLLAMRPEVDSRRIGFIGQADGGNLGGIIAGVEKRIRTLILISANTRLSAGDSAKTPSAFLDGVNYISYAAPATLLFQYAGQNDLVPRETALNCFQCASQPKTINWYAVKPLSDPQARADRLVWLREQLGMNTVP